MSEEYQSWLFKKNEGNKYVYVCDIYPNKILDYMKNNNCGIAWEVTTPGICLCTLNEDEFNTKERVLEVIKKYPELASVVKSIKYM